ncbi:Xaa-Pro dipeptidase [Thalassospira profundimaris]|uniref:Xaa-Pro dipeptidase n=1 Tax=Thalassospira profundimaris TaxID=502049 RepID=A0A367WRS2_9PROT|nr:Xaa-Pro peptidase family protein [Thalassospira profundimaris]RCK43142.1 Xaa-Pro dipeptidase [Thalassospira profundimaris]
MALHFERSELAQRRAATIAKLEKAGLDGLLMFRQESMFYLTGYDTFGYVFFQCLYLGSDGRVALITRAPDLRQARHTSDIEDIRIWVDGPDVNPALQLRDMLAEFGAAGKKLGVEYDAYGLTAANGKKLDTALAGFCTLADASRLVSELRVIKSPAELAYIRRAGELADDAWDAALTQVHAGAFEGDILAAMQGAVFAGGGDYPGNEFIIGAGQDALLCRYFSGRKHLAETDQITLEWAGAYRRYHAAMMRTVPIGTTSPRHIEMHKVACEAMAACRDALKPGEPIGNVFDAYARICDKNGMKSHRLNACGYSMGTTFAPNWMDWPMFYHDNPVIAEPGMVFFLHMILMDSDSGCAMCPGHSVIVTDQGNEALSRHSLDLVTR